MLTDRGTPATNAWNHGYDHDPRCEDCGESLVMRFGEEIAPQFCDSCEADFDRRYKDADGMVEMAEDWSLVPARSVP